LIQKEDFPVDIEVSIKLFFSPLPDREKRQILIWPNRWNKINKALNNKKNRPEEITEKGGKTTKD